MLVVIKGQDESFSDPFERLVRGHGSLETLRRPWILRVQDYRREGILHEGRTVEAWRKESLIVVDTGYISTMTDGGSINLVPDAAHEVVAEMDVRLWLRHEAGGEHNTGGLNLDIWKAKTPA